MYQLFGIFLLWPPCFIDSAGLPLTPLLNLKDNWSSNFTFKLEIDV